MRPDLGHTSSIVGCPAPVNLPNATKLSPCGTWNFVRSDVTNYSHKTYGQDAAVRHDAAVRTNVMACNQASQIPETHPASVGSTQLDNTNNMKKQINRYALFTAFSFGLAALPVSAANAYYELGDLVLYFQKEGGSNTVYANLGNAATFYRGSAAGTAGDAALTQSNILDLNPTLSSAFGAGWASDPSIYAGLAGVWGTSATNTTLTDGDPHRTLYVSSARNSVGTGGIAASTGWNLYTAGTTAMTGGATAIETMNNTFETQYDAQTTVSPTSISTIDNQNPFLAPGLQGNAFGTFQGGVQQKGSASTFGNFGGPIGETEFALDLYRILAKNNISGQVPGDLRNGSFEGTVTVGTDGGVSFVTTDLTAIPEPATVMFTCLLTLSGLSLRNRRSPRTAALTNTRFHI
jgi:hypothetical protein